MKNFIKDNKFVLIVAFLEGIQSKGSKKFFDAAEISGACYYSSSFHMDRFYVFFFDSVEHLAHTESLYSIKGWTYEISLFSRDLLLTLNLRIRIRLSLAHA